MKKIMSILLLLLLSTLVGCQSNDPLVEDIYFTDVWGDDATFESVHLTGQAAGKAPLRMDAGVLLTTPESGTLEYDGTGIYLTNTNHRRYISQAADSIITSQIVSNSIAETTVFTGVLNADELELHRVYRLHVFGEFSTDSAVDTITIRVKINGTTMLALSSTPGVAVGAPYYGWAVFTIRAIGVAGDISTYGYMLLDDNEYHNNITSIAVDTTAINNVIVTFQWDVANVNNIMILDQAFLEVLD